MGSLLRARGHSLLQGSPCSHAPSWALSTQGCALTSASPEDGEVAAFAIKWLFLSGQEREPGLTSQGSPKQPQHAPSS